MRQVFTVNTVGICRTMTNNRKSASPPESNPVVRRFCVYGLCLYFLTVLEGDADIVGAVDGGVVHQRMPVFGAKLSECIRQLLKGLEEGFNVGSLQLHLLELGHDRLQTLLCGIESVRQAVIALLVFRLVEGNIGILINALLYHIRNQLRFFQQGGLFRFQLGSVKEEFYHLVAIGDDLVFGGQQLVCRRQESGFCCKVLKSASNNVE